MKLSEITFLQSKKFELKDPITKKSFKPKVIIELMSADTKEAKNNLLKAQRKVYELTQDEANLEDGKLKPDVLENINRVYFSTLIVGWENIEDFNDVNDENKIKLIENETIFKFVLECSSDLGKFRAV